MTVRGEGFEDGLKILMDFFDFFVSNDSVRTSFIFMLFEVFLEFVSSSLMNAWVRFVASPLSIIFMEDTKRSYSAFNNFGPASKFVRFLGFWIEAKKSILSKLRKFHSKNLENLKTEAVGPNFLKAL